MIKISICIHFIASHKIDLHCVTYPSVVTNWIFISPITVKTWAGQISWLSPCYFYEWTASCKANAKKRKPLWATLKSPWKTPKCSFMWRPWSALTTYLTDITRAAETHWEGGRVWQKRRDVHSVQVLIKQSYLYPPANDEQGVIDMQQRDSLSAGRIIITIQQTYQYA